MAKKKGEVKFIRKNGRIIPIRVGKKKSKADKKSSGAALIAAGIVSSSVLGRASGVSARDAAKLATRSRLNQKIAEFSMKTQPNQTVRLLKKANMDLKRSRGAIYTGKGFALAGTTIGSALIATGLQKIKKGDETVSENFAINIVGGLSGLALTAGFKSAKSGKALKLLNAAIKSAKK